MGMIQHEISGESRMLLTNTNMICNICGEDLGPDRPFCLDEHMRAFPTHRSYRHNDVKLDDSDWIMY
jgi:hypothetical protein